jgi:hypothetical protein
MKAEQSAVSNMVRVELCPNCPFNEVMTAEEDIFAVIGGQTVSGRGSELYLSDGENIEGLTLSSIRRAEDIVIAFDGCKTAIQTSRLKRRSLSCGALVELNQRKTESSNG